jgi:hypothetical protein
MLAPEIKTKLTAHLQPRYSKFIYELGIARGDVIADVVAIGPGLLHGYEIKSDGDTLKRLPNQLKVYDRVFNEVWVVLTSKHLLKAQPLLSAHHGVILVSPARCEVLRPAVANPNVYKRTLVNLLWRQHSIDFLKDLGQARGFLSKRRGQINQKICSIADEARITERVILELDRRFT